MSKTLSIPFDPVGVIVYKFKVKITVTSLPGCGRKKHWPWWKTLINHCHQMFHVLLVLAADTTLCTVISNCCFISSYSQPPSPSVPTSHLQLHPPLLGHWWTRGGWGGGGSRGGDRRWAPWKSLQPTTTPQRAEAQTPAAPSLRTQAAAPWAGADPGLQHRGSGPIGHRLNGEQLGLSIRGQHLIRQVQCCKHLGGIFLYRRWFQPSCCLFTGHCWPSHVQIPRGVRWESMWGGKIWFCC